jgi:hypothetical protein
MPALEAQELSQAERAQMSRQLEFSVNYIRRHGGWPEGVARYRKILELVKSPQSLTLAAVERAVEEAGLKPINWRWLPA